MNPDTGDVYAGEEIAEARQRGEELVPISQKAYERIRALERKAGALPPYRRIEGGRIDSGR